MASGDRVWWSVDARAKRAEFVAWVERVAAKGVVPDVPGSGVPRDAVTPWLHPDGRAVSGDALRAYRGDAERDETESDAVTPREPLWYGMDGERVLVAGEAIACDMAVFRLTNDGLAWRARGAEDLPYSLGRLSRAVRAGEVIAPDDLYEVNGEGSDAVTPHAHPPSDDCAASDDALMDEWQVGFDAGYVIGRSDGKNAERLAFEAGVNAGVRYAGQGYSAREVAEREWELRQEAGGRGE